MNVKKAVRIAMATKDMDQKDVSEASNISQSHLSCIVNGKRSAGIDTLQRIADALEMKLSELVQLGE